MKKTIGSIIGAVLFMAAVTVQAQMPQGAFTVQIGQPFMIGNQTFLITTNAVGQTEVITSGPQGTNTVITPRSPQEAANDILTIVSANNAANSSFYSTNGEWEARVGAAYLQNSGQAVASVSAGRWGVYPSWPNVGVEAGVLQGNNQGKSGTAGEYGGLMYRKVIGDVAGIGGIGGGYDNWNAKPFGYVKGGVEYRQNAHLGEFVDLIYALESGHSDRGLLASAGISYAF